MMNRRSFVKASGLFCATAAVGMAFPALSGATSIGRGTKMVTRMRTGMGTFVSITAVHESEALGDDAIGKAFEEIARLTPLFNRHDSASALSELNSAGKVDALPEMVELLDHAVRCKQLSSGAFEPAILPLVELYAQRAQTGDDMNLSIQEERDIRAVIARSSLRKDGRSILLEERDGKITLDGIAKGYIVDRAALILEQNGVSGFLINAGGDIRTGGAPAGRNVWRVAVESPEKNGKYPCVLSMNNGAVATSGSYEVYYDKQKVFHHLVDPVSLTSPTIATGVTVTASSAMEADALATAAFVLQPEKGMEFISALPGRECMMVGHGGSAMTSPGWQA